MLEGLVKLSGRTNGRIVVVGANVTVDTGGNTVGVVVDVSVVLVDVSVVVLSSAIYYGYTPDKVLYVNDPNDSIFVKGTISVVASWAVP
jgi:hypothetical protein